MRLRTKPSDMAQVDHKSEPSSAELACPSCQFQQRNRGRVKTMGRGRYHCHGCGSVWRELNYHEDGYHEGDHHDNGAGSFAIDGHTATAGDGVANRSGVSWPNTSMRTANNNHAPGVVLDAFERPVASRSGMKSSDPAHHSSGFGNRLFNWLNLSIAGVAFMIGSLVLARPDISIPTLPYISADSELIVRNLTFERLGNGPAQIIKVSGALANEGLSTVEVRPIRLVLKSMDGREVFSWIYKPGVSELAKGGRFSFSSAIGGVPMFDRLDAEIN